MDGKLRKSCRPSLRCQPLLGGTAIKKAIIPYLWEWRSLAAQEARFSLRFEMIKLNLSARRLIDGTCFGIIRISHFCDMRVRKEYDCSQYRKEFYNASRDSNCTELCGVGVPPPPKCSPCYPDEQLFIFYCRSLNGLEFITNRAEHHASRRSLHP